MQSERGSVGVEFAFMATLLIMLASFCTQFGEIYWFQNVLQKSAHAGARTLSLAAPGNFGLALSGLPAQIATDVQSGGISRFSADEVELQCLDGSMQPFAATPPYCVAGSTVPADSTLGFVAVQVRHPLPSLGFSLPGSSFPTTLKAQALFRYGGH